MLADLFALRDQLVALPPKGGRNALIDEFARRVGRAPQTIRAWLKRHAGHDTARKRRNDAGSTRLPTESLEFMASSIAQSVNGHGKSTKPICVAMNIAHQNGLVVNVSEGRVAALLRAGRLDTKAQASARNHQRLRSLHPNHVHQIDPSLCLVYYLGGRQRIMSAEEFNKNKPAALNKVKLKVWRYVRYDHASGCIDVRYFEAAGENQVSLFEFLMWTWARQEARVSYGVPKFLLWDKGSAMTSAGICRLLDALGVDHQTHARGHAWAKGGVENANWIVERHFESRLRDEPVDNVEQLNASAAAWVRDYNANAIVHVDSRVQRDDGRSHVRDDLFALIAHYPGALVELPERDACAWYMRGQEETRVIRDGRITFVHPQTRKSELYSLQDWAADFANGEKVRVSPLLLGDALLRVQIDRADGAPRHVDVAPERDFDAFGRPRSNAVIGQEYKAAPHTAAQHAAKRIAQAAYGEGTSLDEAERLKAKNVQPFQHLNGGKGVVAHTHLGKDELPTRLLPEAQPIQTAELAALRSQQVEPLLGHLKLCMALNRRGFAMTPERAALVRQWHPDGLPEGHIPALQERLRAHEQAAAARPVLRVVGGA